MGTIVAPRLVIALHNLNHNVDRKRSGMALISALFASFYALTLASIPDDYFNDRGNYLKHIERSESVVGEFDFDLSFLFSEPLYYGFNALLGVFLEGSTVIAVYVWFIAFTFSFFVFYFSRNPLMAILGAGIILFTPNLWGMQLGSIRQGVVASTLFWGFFFFRYGSGKFLALSCFLGFVHVSGFLLFFVISTDYFLRAFGRRLSLFWRGLIVSAVILFIWSGFIFISPFLDPKHTQYAERSSNVGGGLFVFYIVFLFLFFLRQSRRITLSSLEQFGVLGVFTYLGMYFFVPIAGRWLDYFVFPLVLFLVSRFTYRNFALSILFLSVSVYLFFNGGAESIMLKTFW